MTGRIAPFSVFASCAKRAATAKSPNSDHEHGSGLLAPMSSKHLRNRVITLESLLMIEPKKLLETLKEFYSYDAATGQWFRIKSAAGNSINRPVGRVDKYGYVCISVRGYGCNTLRAHRLAWLYMTGEWPTLIDHKNLDKTDNRWVNLRLTTLSGNKANTLKISNRTGFRGVKKCKKGPNYEALIKVEGEKRRHLGRFPTPELAHEAYCRAAVEHYGSLARTTCE